jgi:hypothetical protein
MTTRTHDEHLAWCKQQANEYLARGAVIEAIASMLGDLNKHPELKGISEKMAPLGLLIAANRDEQAAMRFIEGFR